MNQINSDKIQIEIWSDVVCPFCYIGKKKLERAIDKLNAQDKVEVVWRSFQLDPDFPKNETSPSIEYLSERKGYPVDQVKAMSAQLANNGLNYGINFDFNKALTFNTYDVHRLIHWSEQFGKSNELEEALMNAYFTQGVDLTNQDNVLSIVKLLNLNVEEAKAVLESNQFAETFNEDINMARRIGVSGVPFFVVNRKQAISGAQDDKVFESLLSNTLNEMNLTDSKGICVPGEECK